MELSDYTRILRQRGWIIILLAILTGAAAFIYSYMQPTTYESTLKLLVSPSRTDFGQAQAAKTLLRGYTQWMNSGYRAQAVIDQLQLDTTPGTLLSQIGIAADDSSFLITLTVEDEEDKVANDIARTWGNLLIQWQEGKNAQLQKEDRIGIEFIDDPQVGLKGPRPTINAVAGAVFGALLGVMLIFALEWIDSGVMRRSEDIERYLDVPVVGKIPSQ